MSGSAFHAASAHSDNGLDPRETRSHSERTEAQFVALRDVVVRAMREPYYRAAFSGLDVASLRTPEDLEGLPLLRKDDLVGIQAAHPPFGGLMAGGSRADHLFVSPGPIHEPGFSKTGFWRLERAMRAAGFVAGDIVHNTFSYHLTPGAWILDAGARALGCSVIPAGNAPIEQQILAISQYGASAYCGTPDFLKTLVEAFQKADRGPVPFTKALVTGGALTPGLRAFFDASRIGALQCYATAELGLIAYETAPTGHMTVDEDVIVEIVDPETGRSMPPGEVGEVVVTTLREDYPLIRFGTGDLSAFVELDRKNGRTGPVLAGWLGRSDQATKVRGMFVRPSQIHALREQVDGLRLARLVVDRSNEKDDIMLFCEFDPEHVLGDAAQVQAKLAEAFRALCHLKSNISIVPEGTLPDDGKVIVDLR
ncbi:phenylacetate--CoA ligase family protein [Oricola cellulosilytica]|uniref:Phenylacetate--CoA ligase family protein n=1 Tax=Oricola cellulosilytica TaxID=1429082 RepID=A0A4R0PBR6_9HYPH|nr:AMP-binding protein [Oricola cellulosilytica]TCD14900.1 phenylacetate--CoA ligase family protein [Oricola cellulosilytica]